jgi:hypothetical protein
VSWIVTAQWLACSHPSKTVFQQPANTGGGNRTINGITILARDNHSNIKAKNPTTLRIGARLPLRVVASWDIPYVGDVTDKVTMSIDNPALAELNQQAVLTARRPGKVLINAVLCVADQAGSHQVLAPTEAAGTRPVLRFTDQMELTIIQ